MEEQLARLTEMMTRLMERVDRQPRRGYEPRVTLDTHHEREERYEDRGLKVELPNFDGTTGDPEVYLEWEKAIERYFEYRDTPEDRKFKLAKMKLTKSAGVWFEGIQRQRVREGRLRISTWVKLKKHLKRKYVPSNYKQTLYIKMSSLKQDRRGVQEYIHEFEKLLIDCKVNESEEMKVRRFVWGLNKDLRNKFDAYSNLGYVEACFLASVFERRRKGNAYTYETPLRKDGPRTSGKRSTTPHPTKTQQRDCPNERAFNIRERKEMRADTATKVMLVETEAGGANLLAESEDGAIDTTHEDKSKEGEFAPHVEEPQKPMSNDSSKEAVVHQEGSSKEGKCDEPLPPETKNVMVIPKEVVTQPQVRKFETFETLFDPPKFLPDFMKKDIGGAETVIVEAREEENVGELLPLGAGEEGDFEQGVESLQSKESEGIQDAHRDNMVRHTMRKFEVFETLFNPPKFIPEFMKQSMVENVETTKFMQCDDKAVFIDGICEEDRGNNEAETETKVEALFCSNVVPFHVINTYAFGSFTVIEFDLNKIRGRIFLKKGRMNQAWVQLQLMLTEWVSETGFRSLVI